VTTAPVVLAEAPGRIRRLAADKGYDADWLRTDLRAQGITPVIPGKRGRKRRIRHDKRRYRERWRIVLRQAQDEGHLQPPQRLPPRRDPLRQARPQLCLSRRPRRRHRFLVLIESRP
jgi:IS5 family transposase